MPWMVFEDFNEISYPDEKLGWMDRDVKQMVAFTWCNGQLGSSVPFLD